MGHLVKKNKNLNYYIEEYKSFVLEQSHPCIMAKTVFTMNNFRLNYYENLREEHNINSLLNDLGDYINSYDFESNNFESFLAVFPNNYFETELKFEEWLWKALQSLHDLDNNVWDNAVSSNVDDPNFSFSLKGHAFYIVGMHPESSRMARQSPYTTIVFNLHSQFEMLREMGAYETVKNRIRNRDKAFQGSINPILKDFGTNSEARQYSGRHVSEDWKCPFHNKNIKDD